ncbi:TPA: hypothetical protein ACX3LN_000420 [Enterobacter hormaechei]|nr:hypothetical protein [Enterobacter hormaechei]
MQNVIGNLFIIITTAISVASLFLGLFAYNKKMKTKAIQKIELLIPKKNRITKFSEQWVSAFFLAFGNHAFSKRQLITIPFLLILYSSILFVVWYLWVLTFRNPEHIIPQHLPLTIKVALHDFIHFGFWYSLLLDVMSIYLIRAYINAGLSKGFSSVKSIVYFSSIVLGVMLSFTLIVTHLKNASIEDLYIQQGLYFEDRPVMTWNPMEVIRSSLDFIDNETMIIFTSKGAISNYFIPQAIMFYLSMFTQLTLLIVFISYMITKILHNIRTVAIWTVKYSGTATMNAIGFILIAGIILLALIYLCLYVISLMV